jgi:hypothetical protein
MWVGFERSETINHFFVGANVRNHGRQIFRPP